MNDLFSMFHEDRLPVHIFSGDERSSRQNRASAVPGIGNKSPSKEPLRVFIVEDERLIAENLKFIVEDGSWQVVGIAASGEEAIKAAEALQPDLLLMDVRIQGELDGVHAAILIYEKLKTKPRILFLSAHSREQFPHLDALPPASFAYLKKPYTPEDLVTAIQALMVEFQDS